MSYLAMVFTAKFVAQKLGVEQAMVDALAENMRPKDGRRSIVDSADDEDPSIHAFTADGVDYIEEMLAQQARS